MFLLKIFYFLKGYVIIKLKKENVAEIVNKSVENNIKIISANSDSVTIFECDYKKFVRLCNVAVLQKQNIGIKQFLMKDRFGVFAVCLVVYAVVFLLSTQYIWSIDLDGADGDKKAEVLEKLELEGLKIGARKSSIPNGNTLKDSIIYSVDGINWAWVYFEGTHAKVQVSKEIPPPKMNENNFPCNISANCDGVISYVNCERGRKLLPNGTTVSKGDVVISGVMPPSENNPMRTVSASGDVYAKTVHKETVFYPLYHTTLLDTGNVFTLFSVKVLDFEIPLWSRKRIPYKSYRTENKYVPIGICKYKYIETDVVQEPVSEDVAVYEARELLYERIANRVSPDSHLESEKIETQKISDDMISVTLTMNFTENIACVTPITTEQTEEFLTNDKTD